MLVLHGHLFRPAVVGLAWRRADDALDGAQPSRQLVAGDLRTAVVLDVLEARLRARSEFHEGRDLLAPARVRHADDRAVEHRGMRFDGRLDLLREDLLATRIDRDRA